MPSNISTVLLLLVFLAVASGEVGLSCVQELAAVGYQVTEFGWVDLGLGRIVRDLAQRERSLKELVVAAIQALGFGKQPSVLGKDLSVTRETQAFIKEQSLGDVETAVVEAGSSKVSVARL